MSYLKKYACFYGDIEFTTEEEAEIGRFKMQLTKLASMGSKEETAAFFAKEFGDMDEECFDRIDRYFEYLSYYDSGINKEAKFGFAGALSLAALGLAATPLIERGISALSSNSKHKESLQKILQQHPALRRDPNTAQYFQAIVDFAPDIAKNAMVAGNIMEAMHRIGPAALDANRIGQLISMQKEIPPFSTGLHTMADPIHRFSDIFRKKGDKD